MSEIIYTPQEKEVCDMLIVELRRAMRLHIGFPLDPIYAVAILSEEAGEAVQAANDYIHHGGVKSNIRKELTHTGAMALRCLIHLDNMNRAS